MAYVREGKEDLPAKYLVKDTDVLENDFFMLDSTRC